MYRGLTKPTLLESDLHRMGLDQVQKVIAAALQKANELGAGMDVAVEDSGANLKAFVRMDDPWVGSIDIALKRAKTACFFGMPTGQIGKLS